MRKRETLEENVEALLNEEITKEELAKKLHIDIRYLSALISELADTNPELYAKYIQKYPYKTAKITHIDYEAAVIEMLKEGSTAKEIVRRYKDMGLSERTLMRKINELEKTNPNLYFLYKKLSLLNRRQIKLTEQQAFEFATNIENLEARSVILGGATDTRKSELEKLESQFLSLKSQGLSNDDAAKEMGTVYAILYKQFADLERIRREESFREALKVEKQPGVKNEQSNKKDRQVETEQKEDER